MSNFKSIGQAIRGLRLPKIGGFSLTLNVALTTVLRTNVLHCDSFGLISKADEDVPSKFVKIHVFNYPTVVWRPLSNELPRISAQTVHWQKLESLGYIFVADSIDLSSFKFSHWAPKDARVLKRSALWPFKVIQGRWFWHQSKARIWLPIRPQ